MADAQGGRRAEWLSVVMAAAAMSDKKERHAGASRGQRGRERERERSNYYGWNNFGPPFFVSKAAIIAVSCARVSLRALS